MSVVYFDWDPVKRQGIIKGDYFNEIREAFSVNNDTARFQRRYARFVPSRKYAITPTGRFNSGLFYEIKKYLLDSQYNVRLELSDVFKNNILPKYNINDIASLRLDLRDYQRNIVKRCLNLGRGVVVLATAGGKTLTMASLIESVYKKHSDLRCLVVVPDLGLVTQTYNDLRDYNVSFTFSRWTGKHKPNLDSNVIIANLGILQSSKTNLEWVNYIDMLVVDEVHKLRKTNKINNVIKKIETPNKFGLTGTLPEDRMDQWNIVGTIGPVIYEKNSKELRDEEYISDVTVQILNIHYKDKPDTSTSSNPSQKYRKEIDFISKNPFRNNVISKLCTKFNNNSLILVDYIDHGTRLYELLCKNCPDKKIYFIRGEVAVEDREYVKALMEKYKNIVVVAISKIFATGVNIKNLHYIIFAGGGKAKVRIIQAIGRGLRLHKDKANLIIIDIADELMYAQRHSKKRIELYKKEFINYGTKEIKEK